MDQAFNLLRDLARARTRRLSDLARAFVSGSDSLMGVTADQPQWQLPGAAEVLRQPGRALDPGREMVALTTNSVSASHSRTALQMAVFTPWTDTFHLMIAGIGPDL